DITAPGAADVKVTGVDPPINKLGQTFRTTTCMWWFGDFFYDFLVIWIIIDPITVLPVFIALTAKYNPPTRRRIAGATVLVSLIVLALFISLGQIIIVGMGISLHAFEIAGGLILFLFAIDLVIGQQKPIVVEGADSTAPMQLAISPLA